MNTPSSGIVSGIAVYAKNKDRVAHFYKATLNLTAVEEEVDFVVLQASGIQITVVRIPEHIAAEIEIASPPQVREEAQRI